MIKILEKMDEWFSDESRWCKCSLFKDEDGQECNIKSAKSYCLVGSFYLSTKRQRFRSSDTNTYLQLAIKKITGEGMPVPEFNDKKETKFEDIKNVIKTAIKIRDAEN
jgi:hypothetical protein